MSMPRESSCQLPGSGSARYVGRVGALAVALGIGAAIATSSGIAHADDDGTGAAGSNTSASSEGAAASKDDNATDKTTTKKTAPEQTKAAEESASNEKDEGSPSAAVGNGMSPAEETKATSSGTSPTITRAESDGVGVAVAPKSKHSTVPSDDVGPAVAHDDSPPAAEPVRARSAARRDETAAAADDVDTHDVPMTPQTVQRMAVTDVQTVAPAAPVPTAPPARGPGTFVTGLVSGLLSAIGLNDQAGTGPAAPPQSTALWAMLGWVRREIGFVGDPATSAALTTAAVTTTSSLTLPSASITATSPLATQEQLAAERIATQTADTLPVTLMKLVLQLGFRSAAQQQFGQVGGPDQGNLDQLAAAVDEYAMGAAFQQQILNSNDPTVVMQVAPPHTWFGQMVPGSRILYDNPDTIYRFMGVNAASSYVISGQFTGERPADTTFSVLTGLSGNTSSVLTGQQLVVNPDGTFTITASREAAAPGQVNHLQLTNDSTLIATRNTLSDWGTEVPMTLSIERVGGPPNSLFSQLGGFAIPGIGPLVVGNPLLTTLVSLIPPLAEPPPLLRGALAAVIMALGIQRESTYMAVATTDPGTGAQIPPNVLKDPTRNAEFLATQLQSAGYFQLADDETLVVTMNPGNAGYFVLPVTNDWTISKDYWNQQTSLNDSQALINPDGETYTLVVSKTDPGVANWVSTGGLDQGTISMRFQDLDPNSTNLPTVSSRVVPLAQLASAVPPGTVYYTEAQRAAQLATRKAGFDNRFAPYPQP